MIFPETMANLTSHLKLKDDLTFTQNVYYVGIVLYHLSIIEFQLMVIFVLILDWFWQFEKDWEIGLFGRDLLDPDHPETMYNELDVEPGKVDGPSCLALRRTSDCGEVSNFQIQSQILSEIWFCLSAFLV